jgi:hypothetical protein
MLPVKILDMSGATYLTVDRCLSELAQIKYKNQTRCGGLVQSSNQRHMDDIRSSTNIPFHTLTPLVWNRVGLQSQPLFSAKEYCVKRE